MLVSPPKLIRSVFSNLTWNIKNETRNIYLTFDDGPIPETTPWVLEKLRKYNVKATFFCIGDNVRKYPKLFQQIIQEGHAVGNHTFNHLDGWKTCNRNYIENIKKAQNLINTELFRPPYGKIKPSQMHLLRNYHIVMWDVLSMDYDRNISPKKCLANVLANTKQGSIIVMHDSLKAEKNMKFVLEYGIEILLESGFIFDKIQHKKTKITHKTSLFSRQKNLTVSNPYRQ